MNVLLLNFFHALGAHSNCVCARLQGLEDEESIRSALRHESHIAFRLVRCLH